MTVLWGHFNVGMVWSSRFCAIVKIHGYLIMACGWACAGQDILKTSNKCLYILKRDRTIKRTPSHTTTWAYDCRQGNRKKKPDNAANNSRESPLGITSTHNNCENGRLFHIFPGGRNEKKNRGTPKKMLWNLQRKTNKCQNNRSKFFSTRLMHIAVHWWPRLGNVWLTDWLNDAIYMYVHFSLFICVLVQFRELSYDQIQSNGCAFYVYWFIGTTASSLAGSLSFSLLTVNESSANSSSTTMAC